MVHHLLEYYAILKNNYISKIFNNEQYYTILSFVKVEMLLEYNSNFRKCMTHIFSMLITAESPILGLYWLSEKNEQTN